MLKQDSHLYEFGPFRLDTSERLLLCNGARVPLTEKAFDTLVALVCRGGRLVTKEELMKEVWPDAFVEENNLDKCISAIRQALGEKPSALQYVETVRGRGYRFVAKVSEVQDGNLGIAADDLLRALNREAEVGPSVPAVGDTDAGPAAEYALSRTMPLVRGRVSRSVVLIVGAGLMAVALSLAAYLWLGGRAKRTETAAAPKSVAVLPFKPLASVPRDEAFELGMADTLITKLGTLPAVSVRPISAVRKYTSLEQDPVAGRELKVEAVLDGSIQRAGDRVRVTVRLTRVADETSLWAGTYDEKLAEIFPVQDSISEQVTRALALHLSSAQQQQLAKRYTHNPEAYQLYLKGRYFWSKRTEDATRKSIGHFEQAVAIDPGYALAYTGLADAYWTLHFLGQTGEVERLPSLAKAAALKALALDDTLAEAHTSLGEIKQTFDLDFAGAEREYKRAIELNPNYPMAHQRYGVFLNKMRRRDEARAEFGRALESDPLSPVINADAGTPFYQSRDYERAAKRFREAIELDPNYPREHMLLAHCYTQMGRYEEAVSEAQKGATLSAPSREAAGVPPLSYQLAYIYAKAGRIGAARQVLEELEKSPTHRNDQLHSHALAYAALGDRERAFAQMEKLYETRNIDLLSLNSDPAWDGMRQDPRFQALLRRFGLTP